MPVAQDDTRVAVIKGPLGVSRADRVFMNPYSINGLDFPANIRCGNHSTNQFHQFTLEVQWAQRVALSGMLEKQ